MHATRATLTLLCSLAAACGSTASPPTPAADDGTSAPAARRAPSDHGASEATEQPAAGSRCLPVVAAECGCVYDCGEGTTDDGASYRVAHSFWTEPLTARVERWCVEGECTDAFFAEIVCSGICAPRPADPTCAFRDGRCGSAAQ